MPFTSVGEVRIAAVDNQIARFQVGQQRLDEVVHGLACLDHQHDLAGPFQQAHHLFERARADNGFPALGGVVQAFIHLGDRPIVRHHRVAVVVHVHDQVLAHDCQTDQSDVCRLFHDLAYSMR
jgi:hypothetical protein